MISEFLSAVIGAFARLLFGRWLAPKDPEKEALKDAIKAEREDAKALAAPPRSDAELDQLVHDHWKR